MKKIKAVIEKGQDGTYGIYTPDTLYTIAGDGASVAEAKEAFLQTVEDVIASYHDLGEEVPAELARRTFDYYFDLASLFDYYSFINVSEFAKRLGINASLMRQYKQGQYISEKQMRKISDGLHTIGSELSAVKLF